jgi:UPF0716 protein FxsA
MRLLLLFLAVPVIEIALFIQVGGLIGLWPTLAIVVLTAVLGSWLVRTQGLRELARLQASFSELRDPTEPLANGAMILVAGVLLLTPGFFTDALGFALLAPPLRLAVFRWIRARIKVQGFTMGPAPSGTHNNTGGPVIDGEFEDVTSKKAPTHASSGWTRH